jgi:signal transduction histidine kinase
MYTLYVKLSKLFNYFVSPKSVDFDKARREFVLNAVLIGVISVTFVALLYDIYDVVFFSRGKDSIDPLIIFILFVFQIFLYRMSRKGKSKFVSEVLIGVLLIIPTYTTFKWGNDVPAALLAYTLIIVMTGILISSLASFVITCVIVVLSLFFNYLHHNGIVIADYIWQQQPVGLWDIIFYNAILAIIALISWLFNRQSEIAFKRASKMEQALIKERDSLEEKVEERTRKIKQIQLERMASLNHMAEIGRMTSGFFHDLVNPLNLVSLNLDRLSSQSQIWKKKSLEDNKILIDRAIKGTKHLSQFISTARNQIQEKQVNEPFSLTDEIEDVIAMLNHKAGEAGVKIVFTSKTNITIYGNSLRFSQVVSNLISNAIDSYDGTKKRVSKIVEVVLVKGSDNAELTVKDFGSGIPNKILKKIFEPFFTTKKNGKGIGIGLSVCRDIVQKELQGEISVDSHKDNGTVFKVKFPVKLING